MTDYFHDIERRLTDAGMTLMKLPMPKDGLPAGNKAAWPDVLQLFWDLAGPAEEGSVQERGMIDNKGLGKRLDGHMNV